MAGALTEDEYRAKLQAAGFTDIELETTRVYDIEDARAFLATSGLDANVIGPLVKGKVTSAFVRACKPAAVRCGQERLLRPHLLLLAT